MKKHIKITMIFVFLLSLVCPFFSQTSVKAENESLLMEKCEYDKSRFNFSFSHKEETGMIRLFDVSDDGKVATCINSGSVNIYDENGIYDFTVYTNITRTRINLSWDNNILLMYLDSSVAFDDDYYVIRIKGFDEYDIYSCPADDNTKKFWDSLEQHDNELLTDKGRYYIYYGNLRYIDNETGSDYAITENTSFRPYWLLIIPFLTVIIWFGFMRKRVKKWEEDKKSLNESGTEKSEFVISTMVSFTGSCNAFLTSLYKIEH